MRDAAIIRIVPAARNPAVADMREAVRSFDINAIDAGFLADPYPYYRALREHDPVHRNPDGSYFLTRHADVALAYKHPSLSSDKRVEFAPKFGDGPLFRHHTTSLVFNDAPYHTRVRRLLSAAFTPRKLAEFGPMVEGIVARLIEGLEGKREFDFISEVAIPLPTEVIAHMLTVPESHRPRLRDYSRHILGALDPVVSKERLAQGHAAVEEFGALLRELIQHRRAHPEGVLPGEVLGPLVFGEMEGERLSDEELVQNCIFLLNAGHETTTSLLGAGLALLMDNPDEMQRLKDNPALIDTAVDEFARFESPVQIGNRKTTEPVTLGDVTVPAGTYLHTSIGGANRDPAVFADPERLDIGRAPNPHLAFIAGRHTCLGSALGKLEGKVALGAFIRRFPAVRRAGESALLGRARFRGYDRLPVAI
jgi:cytochrome P450